MYKSTSSLKLVLNHDCAVRFVGQTGSFLLRIRLHGAEASSFFFFSFLGCGETESIWYVGLLYQPRMRSVEQSMERELAWKTDIFRETLAQCHSAHHKSHMT
jgi:hypothetical protein